MRVTDECTSSFMEMKWKKVHRYIVYKIEEKSRKVTVDKVGGAGESYQDLAASLPVDDCRYAVFDFDFVTVDNCRKSKIFFIYWLDFTLIPFFKSLIRVISKGKIGISYNKNKHGLKGKMVIYRSPEASRIRAKILYATSKDGLRRVLEGIHYELQATDPTEMGFDIIQERAK